MTPLRVGQIIHGFCRGLFGRDHYGTWRIEAVGFDWVVVRETTGNAVDFTSTPGRDIGLSFDADDFYPRDQDEG